MTLVPRVIELLRHAGLLDVRVIVGGIIPEADVPRLRELGVTAVFGPGTAIDEIVQFLRGAAERPADLAPLLNEFRTAGAATPRPVIARLLSMLACGQHLDSVRQQIDAMPGPPARPRTVAITGSGGVGKSTLIGKLVDWVRGQGQTIAVLACDPESSISGGALLGDRIRMPVRPDDSGVFIRSLAAPRGCESLAPNLALMARLLAAAGFHAVIIETAGAGQGDTAVRRVADVVVLLLQPETGDEVQWQKAGIIEIADVVAVHKADLPGADRMEAQLRELLVPTGGRPVAVVRVSSNQGQGIAELWRAIEGR
jgi:LAO/AO transport system ATPase